MARSFNGSTDYIQTGIQINQFASGVSASTITSFVYSAWVILSTGVGSFPVLFGVDPSDTQFLLFGVNVGNFSGLNLYMQGLESKNAASFTKDVWHHVACQYISNGSDTGTITVYDNGVDVTVGNQGVTDTFVVNDTFKLFIANGAKGGNSFWKGSIADVAVWTAANQVAALSVSEIQALAKGVRPNKVRPGNLAMWLPDDGIASPEPDLSGNVRNGTLTGTALTFGPPFLPFTPRRPLNFSYASAASTATVTFNPAWAFNKEVVVQGIGY